MTKIAIVGATGPTGIHLVAELCRRTAAVRVIARDMDKLARLFPDAAVEKRPADILDADANRRLRPGLRLRRPARRPDAFASGDRAKCCGRSPARQVTVCTSIELLGLLPTGAD